MTHPAFAPRSAISSERFLKNLSFFLEVMRRSRLAGESRTQCVRIASGERARFFSYRCRFVRPAQLPQCLRKIAQCISKPRAVFENSKQRRGALGGNER